MIPDSERWNRNIHYHPLLLRLGSGGRVLDVGSGGGHLTRQFAECSSSVVGIDVDEASIRMAQAETTTPNITYVNGDVLSHPFVPESFDLVVSVAALHHMDAGAGLRQFATLVKPGGVIGVIGIGRSRYPRDLPRDGLSGTATYLRCRLKRTTIWHHSSPMVWPPPLTDHEMRRLVSTVLPGATFRRHVHGRHSIVWTKPHD
jgi:ubiquinone/menaquinone biosynthesis C-methylase UbiE